LATLTAIGVVLTGATYQAQQERAALAVQQVTDDLYVLGNAPEVQGMGGGGNTAIFIATDGVALVDTKINGYGQDIIDAVGELTDKPITHVINTHTHFDHSGGNIELPDTVSFVVHENTLAQMSRETCQPVTNCDAFKGENAKYLPKTGYSERMKHVIEPWLSVERATAVDNFDQIVRIDSTDSIVGNTTRLRYGLDNRFYARRGDSGAQEFLTIGVEQTYYTDARASQFDQQFMTSFQQTTPSNLSPLALTARAAITEGIDGSLRAEYDTHFMALRTIRADADVGFGGWLHQRTGWSQRRFVEGLSGFDNPNYLDHTLNSFTNVRALDNKWGGVYQFNYDVHLGRMVQQRILAYQQRC